MEIVPINTHKRPSATVMQRVKEVTLTHDKFVQSAELNGKAKNSLIFPSSSQTIPNTSNEDVTC